jgi:hypothetical protein
VPSGDVVPCGLVPSGHPGPGVYTPGTPGYPAGVLRGIPGYPRVPRGIPGYLGVSRVTFTSCGILGAPLPPLNGGIFWHRSILRLGTAEHKRHAMLLSCLRKDGGSTCLSVFVFLLKAPPYAADPERGVGDASACCYTQVARGVWSLPTTPPHSTHPPPTGRYEGGVFPIPPPPSSHTPQDRRICYVSQFRNREALPFSIHVENTLEQHVPPSSKSKPCPRGVEFPHHPPISPPPPPPNGAVRGTPRIGGFVVSQFRNQIDRETHDLFIMLENALDQNGPPCTKSNILNFLFIFETAP